MFLTLKMHSAVCERWELFWFQKFNDNFVFRVLRNQRGVLKLKSKRNFFQILGFHFQNSPAKIERIVRFKSSSFPFDFKAINCEVFFVELKSALEVFLSIVFTRQFINLVWNFQILVVDQAEFSAWACFHFFDDWLLDRNWLLILLSNNSHKTLSNDFDLNSLLYW